MKKLTLILGIVFVSLTIVNAQIVTPENFSKSKLDIIGETMHDFGDIKQGDKVTYTFKIKNTGVEPLILSNVMTTCGCASTNWTREPIEPGETKNIDVTFDSTGKIGRNNKVITIISNASNKNQRVSIIVNVLVPTTPSISKF